MIEREDMSTLQQPGDDDATATSAVVSTSSQPSAPATLQVPAVALPAQAASPAPALPPMGIDDLLSLHIVSEPQVSPDGAWVAFTDQHSHAVANTTSSAIWLVSSKGGKGESPRQATNSANTWHDTMPRWSPDGHTLAFLSDRAGTPQVYILSLSGGEARQVSKLANGVVDYSWRPDGSVFLLSGYWKEEDDKPTLDSETAVRVYSRLDEQWDGIGYKNQRRLQLWLQPLSGAATRLTSQPNDLLTPRWSPDGAEIAFCANLRTDPDLSIGAALWVMTLSTGQMRRLTPEEGLAQLPEWSPDGQILAFYYSVDPSEAENVSPWIISAHGSGTPHPATSTSRSYTCLQLLVDEVHPIFFSSPQWYPDNVSLLATVQQNGQVHLLRFDTEQGQVMPLTSGNGCYLNPHISSDGQTIAMIRADWFTPGDVWAMSGEGADRRKLSGVNDALLRSRQLARPKRITWKSFDGLEIEGWLYLPAVSGGAKIPLVLEVHGGPSLAWGDSYVHEFQVLVGQGLAVLAANPRGSAGYGEEFCRKVLNDWGGDDFRDLMTGLDHVIATEPVDEHRLGIGGLSYGGYMTNWAITQTTRFKAAVARNGISNLPSISLLSDQALWFDMELSGSTGQDTETLRRSRSALTFAERVSTPLLLLHAESDLRCPVSESMQLFVALRKRRQTVELVRYPGVSHLLDWPEVGAPIQRVDRLRRTLAWFVKFL